MDAVSRSSVDDFWFTWSRHAEAGLLRAYSKAGGPTEAGSAAFLVEVCYWEAELLAAGVPVGCIGPVMVMMWMYIMLNTLLTLLSLL